MESSLLVQAVSLSGKQKTKLSIKISLQQFAPLKMCKYEFTSNESEPGLETVMNELQIHPTLLNSTCLNFQMTGFIPIRVQNFQNVE